MRPRMTDIEETVAEIWSEILKVGEIGVHDDFFDLGGDSLALISVVMMMGERFKLPLDTSIVTEGATIASLANCVSRRLSES
jgi:acyl carrier protein